MDVKHILIATDLSPESLIPCKPVAELARRLGAKVSLLHVVHEIIMVPHGHMLAPPLHSDDEKQRAHAKLALEEQAAALGEDIHAQSEVITSTEVPKSIADYAQRHGVDLIAISTHGRSGFRRLALGSVAEAVLRHAQVPVITFPRPKD